MYVGLVWDLGLGMTMIGECLYKNYASVGMWSGDGELEAPVSAKGRPSAGHRGVERSSKGVG